jgi:hypothetical protein
MAETIESLGDRTGWKVDGEVATYCPQLGGWSARVRAAQNSKHHARWMVAGIDRHGEARYVTHASVLGEAVRVAEGRVRSAANNC